MFFGYEGMRKFALQIPRHHAIFAPLQGEVVEWSMAPDSKSDVG